MRSVVFSTVVLSAGTLLCGCATAGLGPPEGCRSDLRRHADPLTVFVDSVRLQRSVEDMWPEVEGLVLARIDYDSLGALDTATVRTVSLSDPDRGSLTRAILASARRAASADDDVLLFIGDAEGPAVRRVADFRACPPQLLGRADLFRRLQAEGERIGVQRAVSTVLLAEVFPSGAIGEVRVRQSSGMRVLDTFAVNLLAGASMTPAMIEGIPVQTWIQVPMAFNPRGSPGG